MSHPKIICTFAADAIPSLRWSACFDDDNVEIDEMLIGWGRTEQEAIADLIDITPRVEG